MEKKKNQVYSEVFIKLANQLDLSSTRSERVFKTILETVTRTLDVEQASIWQFTQTNMEVQCVAVHGRTEARTPVDRINLSSHTSYLMALHTELSIPVSNVTKDQRFDGLPKEYLILAGIKSSLHVPIRMANKVRGILRLDSRATREWTEEEIQFCHQIANMVSQVFSTKELETSNRQMDTFRNLSAEITHRFNLSTLLNSLVRRCVETVNGSDGMLYLADPDRNTITSTAGYKVPAKSVGQMLRYGEDVAGMVAETGQDLLIKDFRSWSGNLKEVGKKELPTTILCVPLRSHSENVGVLQVTRYNDAEPFTEQDRDIIMHFAHMASLALEKNRLTESTDHLKLFQESLIQIFQTANVVQSATDCLEAAADYIVHALAVTAAIIQIDGNVSVRGLPKETDKLIEAELRKRSRQFDLPIAVSDPGVSDMGYPELADTMKRLRMRAYILKPIRIDGDRTGFICVASPSPRIWSPEEVKMVEVAGQQIGLAIEGMRFHQEARSQADMIQRLTSVTSSLNRLVSLEEIIPMIGQGAVRLSDAAKLAIVLREQDGVVRASWVFGLAKPEIAKVAEKDGGQLLGMFGSTEQVLITKVVDSQLPQSFKKHLASEGVNSARITPIVHSGNIIGLIAALDEMPTDWPHWEMETMETFANTASLALQSVWLYDQLEKGYLDMALSLAHTVDARESEIRMASTRLAEWCQRTAQLLGLSEEDQSFVRMAALLHDIGKVEIPDEVLQKPGPLNAAERKVMEQYPLKSEKMLSPSSRYQRVGKVLRNVHERYDGKGYPDRKKGEDIPLPARILAVADAYGSMIDNRPYRQAHSHNDALQEIMKNSGTQFDPAVVNAFLQTVSNEQTIH